MYDRFVLTLMLTHACNLRCTYCYGGEKFNRSMPPAMGRKAIDRASASLNNAGRLELRFFGGEPLLEPDLIEELAEYARQQTAAQKTELGMLITTNATVTDEKAWQILTRPDIDIALSVDGSPDAHDKHRCLADGSGTSDLVFQTLRRLLEMRERIRVVCVVSPDTVQQLAESVRFLRDFGVREINLALDLSATWDDHAAASLEEAVKQCAQLWLEGLPDYHLSWYDDKAARLADPNDAFCRCGFGKGDIAVSPAGNLYPCERLIGTDEPSNPTRLPGHVLEGDDFLFGPVCEVRTAATCRSCAIDSICSTMCGCCNYARTGDVGIPDKLLCMFNHWTLNETQAILEQVVVEPREQYHGKTNRISND